METEQPARESDTVWFVGAAYGGVNDQTARFLEEGIWENGFEDRHLETVRAMRPGDRIAIKSSYTRKHGLPFESGGQPVSVMAIKAIGTVTENFQDGRRVRVRWAKIDPPREWYFHTHRGTIWRVRPGEWKADALISFAFEGVQQDISRFRNAPFWRERFGADGPADRRFVWTRFYQAIADALRPFRQDRARLIAGLQQIATRLDTLGYLTEDQYLDGTSGFVRDICPFTVMGVFNRGLGIPARTLVAEELANFLGVKEPVPRSFEGIPVLNPIKSWYFPFEKNRDADHIESLWKVFEAAIDYADVDDEESARDRFAKAFDDANGRPGVAWNLTFGLYWMRPWVFMSLDRNSRKYLEKKLRVPLGHAGPKRRYSSKDYIELLGNLDERFKEPTYPVHSYPELSLEAWTFLEAETPPAGQGEDAEDSDEAMAPDSTPVHPLYSIDDIVMDGSFIERSELTSLLERWRVKKNLILQGPPGTGKTWLAKRLAFALIGEKDERKVRHVQFHPNLSYEDFVMGWRPDGDGSLKLAKGTFMEAIDAATKDSASKVVVVIDEINRGNPAQIFGELLTLLEAGKRTPSEAIELCYADSSGTRPRVHIPENLFVIGTMNLADRSLALMDFALRRRFAFMDLKPHFGEMWRNWVVRERGLDAVLASDIERRIEVLNAEIGADPRLGEQFQIGHSYVTPTERLKPEEGPAWFTQVVATDIGPLLDEYWFDAREKSRAARARLTQGW